MVTQPRSQVLMRLHKWKPTIPQIKMSLPGKEKHLERKSSSLTLGYFCRYFCNKPLVIS